MTNGLNAPMRRVVTGHASDGTAVIVSDELVDPATPALLPGHSFHQLWGADSVCQLPDDGAQPSTVGYYPPAGGFRFGFFTVPPDRTPHEPPLDPRGALAEMLQALPGLLEHQERANPGMHTTASVDIDLVISGQLCLEVDDGVTVVLNPGDTVVQNGTRHRWSNPGDIPAVIAVFITGAVHANVPSQMLDQNADPQPEG